MEKVVKLQTKDRIAAMLRAEILSGRIADGEKLTQEQLAETLEVSRMPVREALQMLELEGLLRRLPNRHMQVMGLREDALVQNLRVLSAVEAEFALILAQTGADISCLDPSDDFRFHSQLSGLTGNNYLTQMHGRLLNGYPNYVWESIAIENSPSLNQAIKTAILSADETEISQTIRRYYCAMSEALIKHIKENASHE